MAITRRTAALGAALVVALTVQPSAQSLEGDGGEAEHKRIFGIIPNNRTASTVEDYVPLTPKAKFKIAVDDSFDRGTFGLAALFGAEGKLTDSNPSFGTGWGAYGKYVAASYGDWSIGNMMTEGLYPTLLREEPRYFRRGTGTGWSRLKYAVAQIFWTRTDSGGHQFNVSEFGGNATAVAISNLYYPDTRTLKDNASKVALQIGVDMASNILKEFSPDLDRALTRKRRHPAP